MVAAPLALPTKFPLESLAQLPNHIPERVELRPVAIVDRLHNVKRHFTLAQPTFRIVPQTSTIEGDMIMEAYQLVDRTGKVFGVEDTDKNNMSTDGASLHWLPPTKPTQKNGI